MVNIVGLLDHFASSQLDFMLEVTNRLSTDFVGGIPIFYTGKQKHIAIFFFHRNGIS